VRVLPLAIFLIGPLLLGTAAPVALGKSVSQSQPVASVSSFWTGRIRSIGDTVRSSQRSSAKTQIARASLKQRKPTRAIRAELLTGSTSSATSIQASASSVQSQSPQSPFPTSDIFPVLDQPDILLRHRLIANEMLRLMPKKCHNTMKNFYVRYDNSGQRGVAGKESIVMDGSKIDDHEFRTLFAHEFGHVLDLGCLQGTPVAGASEFKDGNDIMWNDDPSLVFYRISWTAHNVQKEGMKPENFVTGYASWDVFEDITESLTYYIFQRDAFIARARTNHVIAMKLAWIETYVFPGGITIANGSHQWNGEVPWDSTKLPYTWTISVSQK